MASPDNSNPDRVEDLFDAALQISSPAERAAFLERECAGNLPLRQRLEALLRAAAKAGDFLGDKPAASSTIRLTVPITEKPLSRSVQPVAARHSQVGCAT